MFLINYKVEFIIIFIIKRERKKAKSLLLLKKKKREIKRLKNKYCCCLLYIYIYIYGKKSIMFFYELGAALVSVTAEDSAVTIEIPGVAVGIKGRSVVTIVTVSLLAEGGTRQYVLKDSANTF